MTTPRQDVFLFVVGSGRSGTTLLRAMLDAHPMMAVPDEIGFVVRYARPHQAVRYGWPRRFDATACVDLITSTAAFQRWGIDAVAVHAAVKEHEPTTFSDVVRLVYAAYAEAEGKPRYADKTPMHVLHMDRLATLFPEARFVHLVRDGRDVALSYLDAPWGPSTVQDAAVEWRRRVLRGRRSARRLGPGRCLEIRYDDLVIDPAAVLRTVCAFASLPWDDAVLRHDERAAEVVARTRFPAAHQRLLRPPTAGLRDWRRDMSPEDVVAFERIAGPLLDDLGYETTGRARALGDRARGDASVVRAAATRVATEAVAGGRSVARSLRAVRAG